MKIGTNRNTIAARATRDLLFKLLGSTCKACGSHEKLEFDHIKGRNYNPRELSYRDRLNKYLAEFKAGELQTLCSSCNLDKRDILNSADDHATQYRRLIARNIHSCYPAIFRRVS